MKRAIVAVSLVVLALGAHANDELDAKAKAGVEEMKKACAARASQASPEALITKKDGTPMYGDDHLAVQKWTIVFEACRQERIAQWKENAARLRAEAQRLREENEAAYQQQRERSSNAAAMMTMCALGGSAFDSMCGRQRVIVENRPTYQPPAQRGPVNCTHSYYGGYNAYTRCE